MIGELKILQHICPFNEKLPWEAVWDCKVLFYDEEEQVEDEEDGLETDRANDRRGSGKDNNSVKSTTGAIPSNKESNRDKQSNKENAAASNQAADVVGNPRKEVGCKCIVM